MNVNRISHMSADKLFKTLYVRRGIEKQGYIFYFLIDTNNIEHVDEICHVSCSEIDKKALESFFIINNVPYYIHNHDYVEQNTNIFNIVQDAKTFFRIKYEKEILAHYTIIDIEYKSK